MKLQTPDGFTGDVHLHGRSFVVDKKGQVEIPDNLLGQSVWQQGFTVVHEQKAPRPISTAGRQFIDDLNETPAASTVAGKDKV